MISRCIYLLELYPEACDVPMPIHDYTPFLTIYFQRICERSPHQESGIAEVIQCGYTMRMDIRGCRWTLTVTDNGNKYILVVMDYFTKRPEVFAVPNQDAIRVREK
ncbi:hypothetical protein EVAR_97218_1 [Eumeta japonica]|uniref:Uncharacterized protein n=1 Tax=Eumeta variegata TaxID=151549 RepID=A0A4C1WFK2_EUMVA|nr:hypothetical protein EVAR_97218_1 [Eumeta japonica]